MLIERVLKVLWLLQIKIKKRKKSHYQQVKKLYVISANTGSLNQNKT